MKTPALDAYCNAVNEGGTTRFYLHPEAREELIALPLALKNVVRYAKHEDDCGEIVGDGVRCTCGMDAVLESLHPRAAESFAREGKT